MGGLITDLISALLLGLLLLVLVGLRLVSVKEIKRLDGFEVLILIHLDSCLNVSHEPLMLLGSWFDYLLSDLGSILTDILPALICLAVALHGTLAITFHHLKKSLVGVEHHLILFDIDVLGSNGMASQ